MQHLQPNTTLQGGKYKIERVLGQGGFGITYRAMMKETASGKLGAIEVEVPVAIKEFFMSENCMRSEGSSYVSVPSTGSRTIVEQYRKKFVKEANNLAELCHPNIVRVIDVFEENGTDYYVMEYLRGGSLKAMEALVEKAGGTVTGRMAVLAEGGAADRKDIMFLEKLPMFNADGSLK